MFNINTASEALKAIMESEGATTWEPTDNGGARIYSVEGAKDDTLYVDANRISEAAAELRIERERGQGHTFKIMHYVGRDATVLDIVDADSADTALKPYVPVGATIVNGAYYINDDPSDIQHNESFEAVEEVA